MGIYVIMPTYSAVFVKNMKKAIAIFIILAVVVYLSANFVLAMAGANNLPRPKTYIAAVTGDVKIKLGEDGEWLMAKVNDELKSDSEVKTGDDGKVSIVFFDNSIAHVGSNSNIKLSELNIDQKDFSKTKVKLSVQIGRIWSRIMQLADKEATYEVSSSNTVATVRGTVFDFLVNSNNATEVSSIENSVAVSSVQTTEELNKETGQKKTIQKVLKTIKVLPNEVAKVEKGTSTDEIISPTISPLSAEEKNSDWFKTNILEDNKIESEIKNKQAEENKAVAGILPDESFYGLKQLAEKIKSALERDPAAKRKLAVSFLVHRLAEAQSLLAIGKVELAYQIIQENSEALQRLTGDLNRLSIEDKTQLMAILKNQLELQKNLMDQITLGQSAYKVKRLIEDLQVKISPESEKEFLLYQQAKARLKEARLLLNQGENDLYEKTMAEFQSLVKSLEERKSYDCIERLNIIKSQIIGNNNIAPESLKEESKTNNEKPAAASEQVAPKPAVKPAVDTDTINLLGQPAVAPVEKPAPIETKPTLAKLTVTADKYNLIALASKQVVATAVYSDGSTKDVTSLAQWSLSGDIGSISAGGLLQSDQDGGVSTVSASYSEDGVTVRGSSPTFTALTVER